MEVKPGYKQTEVGVIPEEWEVKSFAEIGHAKTGPFGTLLKAKEYYTNEGAPLVSVRDIGEGVLNFDEHTPLVPPPVVRRLPEYVLNPGDIVFGRKGGVDRSAIVTERQAGCFLGSDGIRIRPSKACHAPFVAYQLQRKEIQVWLLQNATGTTMASMNQEILGRISLPFPPLPEQCAIAGALSDVDALIGALDQLIAKKRDLKQAAMQQLLTGHQRLCGFHGEWEVKRLGEVAEVDVESLGSSTSPDFEFNYISLEDVDAGVLRSSSVQVFGAAPSRARRILRKGDILISTVRPNLKSHLLFAVDAPHWVCSTGFAVVRCREGVTHPGYVFSHLFGYSVSQQIDALLTGSNYPAINSGDVRALEIPFPEYAEQTAIASVLSDMDAELAALEQRRDKTRALKQGMMQELLTGRTRLI